jgi:hypothetical protein
MGKIDAWAKITKEDIGTNIFNGNTVIVSWWDYKKIAAINWALQWQVILYPYCKGPYVIYIPTNNE